MEITRNLIDIEGVIAEKNPGLLKVLPGFVIAYLKRIVHQDFINDKIYRNRDKVGLPFVEVILQEFGVKMEVKDGRQQTADGGQQTADGGRQTEDCGLPTADLSALIPASRRLIIAANHPLGGLDGMALMNQVGKVRPDIVFPVNDLLMNVPGLKPLFIPINKHGKNSDNIRIIDETFASEKTILYFPAGLVSRKRTGGVIADLEWKKTFISKARKFERDILPVYISGRNSAFFYNLSLWRRRLGIKANIEMLYLVDEMVKQKDKTICMIFGDIIPWQTFDRTRSDSQWAEQVREIVYSLAGGR
jgi:putative hemolysin